MTRTRLLLIGLCALCALASWGASAQAAGCSDTWYGPGGNAGAGTSGVWGLASNWSSGAIPATSDDVCITAPGSYTVTVAPWSITGPGDTNFNGQTVNSLTLGGASGAQTLIISGQASASNSNETLNTTFLNLAASSTIAATGTLILDSTAGGMPGSGPPYGGGATISGGPLLNYGHIVTQVEDTNTGAGAFFGLDGFTNEPGASVAINSGTLTESQAPTWTASNQGTITVAAGASWALAPTTFSTAAFTNDGSVVNNGSITDVGAGWTQAGGSVSGGPVVMQTGASLADAAGAAQFLLDYGTVTVTGTIPAGQTVTVDGAPYNSGGETNYSTTTQLGGAQLVNDGTLVLDAPGTGTTSGGSVYLTDGSILNNGTINAEVQDPSWAIHLQAGVSNSHGATFAASGGALDQDNGTATTNDGVVSLGPGVAYLLDEGSTFVNAADGTFAPALASASSFGSVVLGGTCCNGPGSFTAGGTLAPSLSGGFTPAASEEFQLFALSGGKFTATFASVSNGFSADYAKETASPAYVGAIYQAGPAPPSAPAAATAHVASIAGGHAKLTVALSCPGGGGACGAVSLSATVTEHLKGGKLKAISASAGKHGKPKSTTKIVVIATAGATLSAGASKTYTLTLNAAGRALLKRFVRLKTLVTVSSGGKTIDTATVSVTKAAKPKKKR